MSKTNELLSALKLLSKNSSYAESLTYSVMLNDNMILHKDGAISSHFAYFGPDVESETDSSLDALSAQIEHALSQLEEGWMFEMNLISRENSGYKTSSHFHNLSTELIDLERSMVLSDSKAVFETKTYISLTFINVNKSEQRLLALAIDGDNESSQSFLDKQITKFNRDVSAFSELLKAFNIELKLLEKDDLLSYLFNCVNHSNQKICASKSTIFLDSYLSNSDLKTGMKLSLDDDKKLAVLALDDMPNSFYPVILDELSQLSIDFRWSTRFLPMSQQTGTKIFKKKLTEWNSKVIGFAGMISQMMGSYSHKRDEHAQDMAYQTESGIKELSRGSLWGYMNSTIIVSNSNNEELEENVADIIKVILSKGFSKVRREGLNATDAFLGSLPSHGGYNVRKIPVSAEFLADILPTTGIYQGQNFCPFLGEEYPPLLSTVNRGSRVFDFNPHYKDVGHQLILGPTGTGKSVLMGLQMCQFKKKYENVRVVGFDYNNALMGAAIAIGAKYFDIYDSNVQLSPFFSVLDKNYRFGFLSGWLDDIYSLMNGKRMNAHEQTAVIDALNNLSEMPVDDHNLITFISQIMNSDLQAVFVSFRNGSNGIFDGSGSEDIFIDNDIIFESKNIMSQKERISVPIFSYLFYKIDQICINDPKPTLMPIDELSFFLNYPILENKIVEIIKTGRHSKIAAMMATQSLNELSSSPFWATTQDQIFTNVFLPNAKVREDNIAKAYMALGMNEQELSLIANAVPKRDYYVRQRLGNKMMTLQVGSLILAFLGHTIDDKDKILKMQELSNTKNESWVVDYFDYLGLTTEKEIAENVLQNF